MRNKLQTGKKQNQTAAKSQQSHAIVACKSMVNETRGEEDIVMGSPPFSFLDPLRWCVKAGQEPGS